jgi:phospholipase C
VAYTGTSLIEDTKGRIIPYENLVLDWLTEHGVSWRVYHSGLSFFLLFGSEHVLTDNFRSILHLAGDLRNNDEPIPQVIFIEPEYNDSPVHFGFQPNDNHPPLPIGPGEEFLRQVYIALSTSPIWARTMWIITYDEHGGFFDHVQPQSVEIPLPSGALYHDAFKTTGVRVPAMVVSPFVRSTCYRETLDHTSILQMLAEKFAGDSKKYSDDVTRRLDQGIGNLSSVLETTARQDLPTAPTTPIRVPQTLMSTKVIVNENQRAFQLAGKQLLQRDRNTALGKYPQLLHLDSVK